MSNYVLVHGGNISTDTWNKLSQRNDYPAGENLGEKNLEKYSRLFKKQRTRCFYAVT